MPQEIRIVALLPDEHEVRCSHEDGDERTAGRRARKRIGSHAEPAGMVAFLLTGPELLVLDRLDLARAGTALLKLLALHPRARGSQQRVQAVGAESAGARPAEIRALASARMEDQLALGGTASAEAVIPESTLPRC